MSRVFPEVAGPCRKVHGRRYCAYYTEEFPILKCMNLTHGAVTIKQSVTKL